jgi:hypothetical protein
MLGAAHVQVDVAALDVYNALVDLVDDADEGTSVIRADVENAWRAALRALRDAQRHIAYLADQFRSAIDGGLPVHGA